MSRWSIAALLLVAVAPTIALADDPEPTTPSLTPSAELLLLTLDDPLPELTYEVTRPVDGPSRLWWGEYLSALLEESDVHCWDTSGVDAGFRDSCPRLVSSGPPACPGALSPR